MKSKATKTKVTPNLEVHYQGKVYDVSALPVAVGEKLPIQKQEEGVMVDVYCNNKWCIVPEVELDEMGIRKLSVNNLIHSYPPAPLPPKNESEWSVDELAFLSAFRGSSFKDRIDLFITFMYAMGGDVQDADGKFAKKLNDAYLGNELDYMMMYLYFGMDKDDKLAYLQMVHAYEIDNGGNQL